MSTNSKTHAVPEETNNFGNCVITIGNRTEWRPIGHFRVPLCLCFKSSQVQDHSYEIDFDLHENETACRTNFHMKGFALRPVLKQRHKRTRRWPIRSRSSDVDFVNHSSDYRLNWTTQCPVIN